MARFCCEMGDINGGDGVVGQDLQPRPRGEAPQGRFHPDHRERAAQPPRVKRFVCVHAAFCVPVAQKKSPRRSGG